MLQTLKRRVEQLKAQGLDNEENICKTMYIYVSKMGISVEEFKRESIPSVIANLYYMQEQTKEEEREMKRVKRR